LARVIRRSVHPIIGSDNRMDARSRLDGRLRGGYFGAWLGLLARGPNTAAAMAVRSGSSGARGPECLPWPPSLLLPLSPLPSAAMPLLPPLLLPPLLPMPPLPLLPPVPPLLLIPPLPPAGMSAPAGRREPFVRQAGSALRSMKARGSSSSPASSSPAAAAEDSVIARSVYTSGRS